MKSINSEIFKKPEGVSEWKWRFLLYKRYFDVGYGITSYVKYFIAFFGLSSLNVGKTLLLGLLYAVLCSVVGYFWFRGDFAEVDQEIGNRFNLFVREMRDLKDKIQNGK